MSCPAPRAPSLRQRLAASQRLLDAFFASDIFARLGPHRVPGRGDRATWITTNVIALMTEALHYARHTSPLRATAEDVRAAWGLVTGAWRRQVTVQQFTVTFVATPGAEPPEALPDPPQEPIMGLMELEALWRWLWTTQGAPEEAYRAVQRLSDDIGRRRLDRSAIPAH